MGNKVEMVIAHRKLNLRWVAVALVVGLSLSLASRAGSFLVLDEPRTADLILVLAGETDRRPQRALELLAQGYGKRILLDVPNNAKVFGSTEMELAEKYVHDLPQAASIGICPIEGLSTKAESKDVEGCLAHESAQRILIVTSDFHTRRALSIFRHELHGHEYSVAATRDDAAFGDRWWTHRQWTKTFTDEWMKIIWWKAIDQWR